MASMNGPIAIGGCGSSGTSLIRRILDAHSMVACGKEMSVFDRPPMYEISLEKLRSMYARQDFSVLDEGMPYPIKMQNGASYFGLRTGNHGETYHSEVETQAIFEDAESIPDFWDRYFEHYARKQGKERWAEKTPGNIFCAEDFLNIYPKGKFLHVVRDGRDVCLSLIGRRNFHPHAAVVRWIMSVEAGREVSGHDRVYELRYEELVEDPEPTLRQLFEWLELPYENSVLEYHRKDVGNNYGYATTPIHTRSVGRWERQKDDISPTVRSTVEFGLRTHLKMMGYAD